MLAILDLLRGRSRSTVTTELLAGTEATSPAAAGYAVSTAATGFMKYNTLTFIGALAGATGGTLDVIVETSADGTDWYEVIRFTQLASGGAAAVSRFNLSPTGGAATVVVGKNLTTTTGMVSGTSVNGQWFDQLRVRYIAGTSTSAGAVQKVTVVGTVLGK
jgi:hypothetical protein